MRPSLYSALFIGSLAIGHCAHADTFSFTFSNGIDSGSGSIVANATSTPGEYLATSISGVQDGVAIASLLAPGTYPSGGPNDNYLFPSTSGSQIVDYSGISFSLSNGTDVNIYNTASASIPEYILVTNGNDALLFNFTLADNTSSSVTPEPSSLVLLGSGVLGAAGVIRRRLA